MKTERRHFLLILVLLGWGHTVQATSLAAEAEKAQRIKSILKQYPLALQRGGSIGDHSTAFCNGVFAAMKRADKASEYIEPVVKTDDPNHPALARYNEATCPNERGIGETTYGGDVRHIGDHAYRLYRIDTARKFKNGLEEIVYGEQIIPVPSDGSLAKFSGYQQVDFQKCLHYMLLGVTPQTYKVRGMQETLNAKVRYKNRYYVLKVDLEVGGGVYIPIWLHPYRTHKLGAAMYPLACHWEYLTTTPNGTSYYVLYDQLNMDWPAVGGEDVIYAGAGEDWVRGGYGNDYIDGGNDTDKLWGEGGTAFFETIHSLAGDDVVTARAGNDTVDAGDGADIVFGGDDKPLRPLVKVGAGGTAANDGKWRVSA